MSAKHAIITTLRLPHSPQVIAKKENVR